jgi:TRAP-type C4-dicarboxylate transport system permease small subunit
MAHYIRASKNFIRIIENILTLIGAGMLTVLMFLGASDVIMRYVFNNPITGAMELSQVLMAGVVFLGWGYAQATRSNVRIDFILAKYPLRTQVIIDFAILVLTIALFSLIAWESAIIAMVDWEKNRLIDTILFPIFPFKLLVPLGAFIVCLECIIQMLSLFPQMKRKRDN